MTSLTPSSVVCPGKVTTLNIDLCSRFPERHGRWANVEKDWMPVIQNTINRKSSHVAGFCHSCHSSNRHMHTSTTIT